MFVFRSLASPVLDPKTLPFPQYLQSASASSDGSPGRRSRVRGAARRPTPPARCAPAPPCWNARRSARLRERDAVREEDSVRRALSEAGGEGASVLTHRQTGTEMDPATRATCCLAGDLLCPSLHTKRVIRPSRRRHKRFHAKMSWKITT